MLPPGRRSVQEPPKASTAPLEYRGWCYEPIGFESGRQRYRFTMPDGRTLHMPCADDFEIRQFIESMQSELRGL